MKILACDCIKIHPRLRSTHEPEMQVSFNRFGSLLMGKHEIHNILQVDIRI